jgi:hypothetical protein
MLLASDLEWRRWSIAASRQQQIDSPAIQPLGSTELYQVRAANIAISG